MQLSWCSVFLKVHLVDALSGKSGFAFLTAHLPPNGLGLTLRLQSLLAPVTAQLFGTSKLATLTGLFMMFNLPGARPAALCLLHLTIMF